ncbi:lamina-associated polypeptide 2, isoforms beta/gamma-like isoform X4 [Polyodon spathula]|uniref:lamina-associated polypeptide 2, isoforms beta/gamma-like isoform X4 n=1 Tax=Polyodon spathula TaxID=7913 RepID=UPI001B7E6447|nr:lamina-associated polypeptide 2, isoforms beta/gamma-like isoform X4 [Polyodon spathula]
MSEFLEDPSVLTKDKLKSELLANSVTLPSGEHRKDVYIQLYLQNLTTRNTAMNRTAPEAFSSDEEQAAPVASSRNRSGRKATKKTDKPRPEDLDVTQLTPEELKDELMKYGFQPGPVVSSTRKLYEKKLQKLLDEGPLESQPAPPAPAPAADNNQNGNTDSDQYSDKEQEEMPKPVLEKREPLKSKAKPPASLRTRRLEQKRSMSVLRSVEQEQEEEAVSAVGFLNVKRRSRAVQQDQAVPGSDDTEIPEPLVVRRVRDVSMGFGSNKLPHIQPQPIQPPNESRAGTPRKLSTHNKESEEEGWRDTIETPPARQTKIPRPAPVALLDTALLEEDLLERMTEDAKDTPKQKIRQQKIFAFLKPVKPQVEGRIAGGDYVEQTQEKDILEEMFPNQVATPTGISATCRRPIRGAAGRPLDSSSFRLDDSLLLLSQTSYRSNLRTESFKPASPAFTAAKTNSNSSTSSSASGSAPSRRSFPVWIQLLLLSLVAGFLFFIYQAMETNHMNPFTQDAPAASTPQVQDQ